jgi:hypothetical protein
MLRPLTALERSAKAVPILRLLARHGELPAHVILKTFADSNVTTINKPPMSLLIQEGYITERMALFQGVKNHFFKITKKGRAALK